MKLVGFTKQNDGTYREFLPYNEQLSSDVHKRAIFFSMFNSYMDKELQFSNTEISRPCNIEKTFKTKIITEIDISFIKPFKPNVEAGIHIDFTSTLLIHAYFLGVTIAFPFKKKPFLLVGKLISLIYTPSGLSLMLNLEDMFLHLVYERIKKVNRNAEVLLFEDSIVIKDRRPEVPDSLIIPSYRKIEKDNLFQDDAFKKQMHTVQETLNTGEITQVYLVYPKHPNFKKYININMPKQNHLGEGEYQVKIMPYSFSFCTKNNRRKIGKITRSI